MFKQLMILILVSAAVVFSISYTHEAVQLLLTAHEWISQLLTDIFSGGHAGHLARSLIALLSVPILIGLVPAILYWAIKRHWFPYFMEIVWVVWLIQAGALVVMSKGAL